MSANKVVKSYRNTEDQISKYVIEHSSKLHPVQEKLMNETLLLSERVSAMMGAPEVLQLNQFFIQMLSAKKIIDIGTFTGMSSLAAALVIPDEGKIITCDINDTFSSIAKKYWEEAGVSHKINLHLRPAAETLQELLDNGEEGTFDFVFIDADKKNYIQYYEMCLKLVRKGGLISIDNVLWSGKVIDQEIQDDDTVIIRELNDLIASDDRVHVSMQNIGDGLTICLKK